jgi:hypothetical protein
MPVASPGIEALVAAKSRLLVEFSSQIAAVIAKLEK